MSRFQGKTVLVTGGTSGIGLATAERIQSEGGRVIVTGSRPASIEAARDKLPGAEFILNDAGDPAAAAALADAIQSSVGELDAVYLNAGFGRFHSLDQVSVEEFDAHYDVLVKGPLLQAKALAPLVKDGGSIAFTSSVVNAIGLPGSAIYASTKGAVRTLVRVLARELAGRNIRVNAVAPGPIGSGFFERTGLSQEEIEGFGAQLKAQIPLGRFGEPREVAAVASFLLSEDASFVTGS
ncbi:MAG: SDR family oxidoreductase, partial [Pseudomonadota bacterium]